MAYPVIFTQLAAGVQPLSDFDTMFNVVGSMGTIFCTASGTNTVALALNANMPAIAAYANYQAFGFVAFNNSTGSITLNVAGLGALPAYAANGVTQLGSGAIAAGTYYVFAYNSALNSAAGGFQLVSANASGPAFSAYLLTNQSIVSTTLTKVTINTVVFDTNSNFDNVTNYRFTPTVGGYYQVNFYYEALGTAIGYAEASIYKNGSAYASNNNVTTSTTFTSTGVSQLIQMNGSTDYIEFWVQINATSPIISGGSALTYASASMIRGL